jgi:hypothetical protein
MSEEKKYCKFCKTEMEFGASVSVSEDDSDSQARTGEYFCPKCDARFVEDMMDGLKRRLD